jgi:hypothetical protein
VTAAPYRCWLIGLPLLVVQTTAAAQTADVGYLVARMPVGTDRIHLEIRLHADSDCASRPVKVVATTLYDLGVNDLSRGRHAMRLTTKIRGITPAKAPFVEISGSGLVPASSRCQQWYRPGVGDIHARAMALRARMQPPPSHTSPNGTRSLLMAARAGPTAR